MTKPDHDMSNRHDDRHDDRHEEAATSTWPAEERCERVFQRAAATTTHRGTAFSPRKRQARR